MAKILKQNVNDFYGFLPYIEDFLDEKFLIYGEQLIEPVGRIYHVVFKDYSDFHGGIGYEIDVLDYQIDNLELFHNYCQNHDLSELFYRGSIFDGLKVNHWLNNNPFIKIFREDFELNKTIQFLPWCKDDVMMDHCHDALFLKQEDAQKYLQQLKERG